MQHTEKYNFSLIDADDAFSPDALNANARQLEDQLARVEDGVAAETARVEDSLTAEIARLDAAAAAEKTRVNGEVARLDAALAQRPRIVTGSYTGSGVYGKSSPNRLDFAATLGAAPKLVIVSDSEGIYQLVIAYGATRVNSFPSVYSSDATCVITWTGAAVQWYNETNSFYQMSVKRTYYYVAFA